MKKLIINIEDTPPSLEQIAELKAEYSDLNEKCKGRNWLIGFGFFASAFLIIPVWLGNFMAISDWFHEILVSIAPQYGSVIPLFSIFLAFFTPPLLFFYFGL
ncbi:hypothetical protein [Hydrogenovibrio marinus]|uniref:Uncharacterized protein n=1 Tax=Hydrogenovibrio marinus TaxID=28885 RepID=A0A066ZX38_HYDMR|nr:hypothetical protein [Hydrogenovibrio marinus]KDN94650.1 hypothetical protein EI16_12180 [Hydrogenovibrio marinus]